MRLYDEYGKLVINSGGSGVSGDYILKNAQDIITGTKYTFNIAGSNFRIKDGKAQLYVQTSGLWHSLIVEQDDNGVRYVETADTGEV